MIKTRVLAVLFGLLILNFPFVSSAQLIEEEKIGKENIAYADVQEVFDQYQKTKDLEDKLKSQSEVQGQKIQVKRDEIDRLREELKSQEFLLTEEARKQREEEIIAKTREFNEFVNSISQEINEREQGYTDEIIRDIMFVIKELQSEKGYDSVYDKNSVDDITWDCIERLNKKYRE